jgi:hypothetical protein
MFRLFHSHRVTAGWILNQPSRDAHTTTQSNVKQQNIFNVLFVILTQGKLELRNTNVNNCILENIHIVCPMYHISSSDDG